MFLGGPGSRGEIGLFFEIGPYYLNDDLILENRTVGNWNKNYHVLFLDQPIGTGYSTAGSSESYAKSQDDVATDLYFFLQRWYESYPSYSSLPLFITGESYGGHYIPAFADKIIQENTRLSNTGNTLVQLKGIAIGDGLTDPCSQVEAGPRAAYDLGIIDLKTFAEAKAYALQSSKACLELDFTTAHKYREEMEDLVISRSGINQYDVRIFGSYTYNEKMSKYLSLPETKLMLHVPVDNKVNTDSQVSECLYDDVMRSQADKIPVLLKNNVRVLLYQVR